MRPLWKVEENLKGDRFASIPAVLGATWITVLDTEFDAAKQRAYEVAVTTLHKPMSGKYRFPIPHTWLVDPQQEQLNWATLRRAQLENGSLAGVGTFEDHYPRLQRLLRRTQVLVGWNIGNDKNVLEAECRRNLLTYGEMKWVDLGQMFKLLHLMNALPTLSEACSHYGIVRETGEAHFAVYDAIAAAELLAAVCEDWLAQMMGRGEQFQIAISGYLGNGGWDPRIEAVVPRPASVRVPSGDTEMREYLTMRDRDWRWQTHLALHYPGARSKRGWQEMDPELRLRLKVDYHSFV